MRCEYINTYGSWKDIYNACMTTIGKEPTKEEPSSEWKMKLLRAEHSPIRMLQVHAKWIDLPYWVSVHLVRHKIGIEHFVRSQRSDKTGLDRSLLSQDALVEHEIVANAQAIINISRKRLCTKASPETREAWYKLLAEIYKHEPELWWACQVDCEYRGGCCEITSCGMYERKLNDGVGLRCRDVCF